MFGRATFEVQLFKNGRWAISEVVKSETVARKKAADLLALKTTAGVRIIKESHFGKDNHRESEIFKEMKEEKNKYHLVFCSKTVLEAKFSSFGRRLHGCRS